MKILDFPIKVVLSIYILLLSPQMDKLVVEKFPQIPEAMNISPYHRLDMSLPRKMAEEILQASGIVKTIDLEII